MKSLMINDLVRIKADRQFDYGYKEFMSVTWKIIADDTGYVFPPICLIDGMGYKLRVSLDDIKRATKAQQTAFMLEVMKN